MTQLVRLSDELVARMLELNSKLAEENALVQSPSTALAVASMAEELQALRLFKETHTPSSEATGFQPAPIPMSD